MTRRRTDVTPTQLRDLEACPLRAHLRHRCGLTDPGDEQREVGGIVAACLAAVTRPRLAQGELRGRAVAAGELLAALEARGGSPGAVRRAAEILEPLASQLDLAHTVAVEDSWQLEVGRDPRTGWAIVAGGRFERVDRLPDGTVRLVDYRTGRVRSREELLREGQVGLRLAALRALHPGARVEALVWWVDQDVQVSVPWSEREDWFARLRVRIAYGQLQRGESTPRVGAPCARCPFRQRCWAYQEELRTLEAAPPAASARRDDPRWLLEERERLKQVAALAEAGRRDLDEAIRARIDARGELRAGDLRARLITRRLHGWSPLALPIVADALQRDALELLEEVGQVSTTKLRALLQDVPEEARAAVEAHATRDVTQYVEVREVAPFRGDGEEAA
ncbi:MAG: PD-(D/E)XK nuclease family protein [Planctomycetota bacterium]